MRKRDLATVITVIGFVAVTGAIQERGATPAGEASRSENRGCPPPVPSQPDAARPRMVDVGAATCRPCRYMAPILEEARRDLAGVADVEFVDLRFDRGAADRYRIRALPTQIFYDRRGREVERHEGTLEKHEIVGRLMALAREPATEPRPAPGAPAPDP